jgi:manganese/iron transport system ATP-binding protein
MSLSTKERRNDYMLRVSNLGVNLQNRKILDDVSFELERGTTLAIVGPNGAGKTVLFRTLLGLIPHAGKIEWRSIEGKMNSRFVTVAAQSHRFVESWSVYLDIAETWFPAATFK